MTTIIAFVSQKGGVGKSTLSRGLAREAARNGLSVKIATWTLSREPRSSGIEHVSTRKFSQP